ncbi:MAG: prolipoprotein diacylglyceryl transferase [Chitinophagaceae bacterium]|nr:prolipoprotein diacylglyceryl transferase [Chitinophagaceae bacterium]
MYPTVGHLLHFRLPIPTFGCFMVLAFITAYYTFLAEFSRRQLPGIFPRPLMDKILFWCTITGLTGAFLFSWIEHHLGFNYYGALLAGTAAYLYITTRNGIPFPIAADIGSPGMMLAYGVGRLGCHLSGDGDWGVVVTQTKPRLLPAYFWSSTYPHNVLRQGVPIPHCTDPYNYCTQLPAPVYPTSLYEAIGCILLFLILWTLRRKIKRPGLLFGLFALLNGIERFTIEIIRINPRYHFLGLSLSQAQIIALGCILIGIFSLRRANLLFRV